MENALKFSQQDYTHLRPAAVPFPPMYSNFPKPLEVATILYEFTKEHGGRIDERTLAQFFKKYPECRGVLRRFCLKDFCTDEISDGLLHWRVEASFDLSGSKRGFIYCKNVNDEKIAQRLAAVKQRLSQFRTLEATISFDEQTKFWLVEESILRETFPSDFCKLRTVYEKSHGRNLDTLVL